MTDLRTAAQQALEAMRCAVPTGKITLYEWDKAMAALRTALAQQAEPLGWAVQIGTHSAGRRQGKPRYVLFFNKADAEALADRTRGARPEPFYLEGQPSRTVPVYTAPPQRKPLTEEEIVRIAREAGLGWDDKYHWYVGSESLVRFARLIHTRGQA